MTASQFIKIMLALEMSVGEVNAMLDGRRPKIEELPEVAGEMAQEIMDTDYCSGGGPNNETLDLHFRLTQISAGKWN